MTLEQWAYIGEMIAAAAVVASLVYLAIQVRQNTSQLQQDNFSGAIRGALDTHWYVHRDDKVFDLFRKGCQNFKDLSAKDQAHFHSILVDHLFYYQQTYHMDQSGLLDKSILPVHQLFIMGILSTPGGKHWWEYARSTGRPIPEFLIDHIQSLMDAPDTDYRPITELQPWFAAED